MVKRVDGIFVPVVTPFDSENQSVGTEMLEQVLEGLSAAGKTLVISTHDMDFAFRGAERVLYSAAGGSSTMATRLRYS